MLQSQHMKTTISLPNPLHQRLTLAAKAEQKSLTLLIQELLDEALATQEQERLDRMYATLGKLRGIAKADSPDISSTIDETLYGAHDAHPGDHDQ